MSKTIAALLIILMLVIFSSGFDHSSSAETDTASPVITAKINGAALEIAAPNHVTLPAKILFTADKPVTIYYTTSGGDPTTSSTYTTISSANSTAAGPTLDTADYMLLTIGMDAAGSLTPLMTYTFVTP
jgi:hypothetical protein